MRQARRSYSSKQEYKADMMAIPEEGTIKPMTKGDDCVPVTMHDIFAHRKEAHLTSKMMSKEVNFDKHFDNLLKDIKTPRDNYYRGKDIRNGWALTIESFMDLTPYYKQFFNQCTRDSMKLLLLQTRKALINMELTDKNRMKKRSYKAGSNGSYNSNEPAQLFKCASDDRLTPLSRSLYGHFFEFICHKRVGILANKNISFYLNRSMAYSDTHLTPYVRQNEIAFMCGGDMIDLKSWRRYVDKKEVSTHSKLEILQEAETSKAAAANRKYVPYNSYGRR